MPHHTTFADDVATYGLTADTECCNALQFNTPASLSESEPADAGGPIAVAKLRTEQWEANYRQPDLASRLTEVMAAGAQFADPPAVEPPEPCPVARPTDVAEPIPALDRLDELEHLLTEQYQTDRDRGRGGVLGQRTDAEIQAAVQARLQQAAIQGQAGVDCLIEMLSTAQAQRQAAELQRQQAVLQRHQRLVTTATSVWDRWIAPLEQTPAWKLHYLAVFVHGTLGCVDPGDMLTVLQALQAGDRDLGVEDPVAMAKDLFHKVGQQRKRSKKKDEHDEEEMELPIFLVEGQLQERLGRASVKPGRWELYVKELALVLKAIVRRLIAVDRYQQLDAELAANYFLGRTTPDGKRIARFSDIYQRRTGRVLHKKKLEQILAILVEHGFIRSQNWKNRPVGSDRRFRKAEYFWGPRPLQLIGPLDPPTTLDPH